MALLAETAAERRAAKEASLLRSGASPEECTAAAAVLAADEHRDALALGAALDESDSDALSALHRARAAATPTAATAATSGSSSDSPTAAAAAEAAEAAAAAAGQAEVCELKARHQRRAVALNDALAAEKVSKECRLSERLLKKRAVKEAELQAAAADAAAVAAARAALDAQEAAEVSGIQLCHFSVSL
jgi:hypothetical protein